MARVASDSCARSSLPPTDPLGTDPTAPSLWTRRPLIRPARVPSLLPSGPVCPADAPAAFSQAGTRAGAPAYPTSSHSHLPDPPVMNSQLVRSLPWFQTPRAREVDGGCAHRGRDDEGECAPCCRDPRQRGREMATSGSGRRPCWPAPCGRCRPSASRHCPAVVGRRGSRWRDARTSSTHRDCGRSRPAT